MLADIEQTFVLILLRQHVELGAGFAKNHFKSHFELIIAGHDRTYGPNINFDHITSTLQAFLFPLFFFFF